MTYLSKEQWEQNLAELGIHSTEEEDEKEKRQMAALMEAYDKAKAGSEIMVQGSLESIQDLRQTIKTLESQLVEAKAKQKSGQENFILTMQMVQLMLPVLRERKIKHAEVGRLKDKVIELKAEHNRFTREAELQLAKTKSDLSTATAQNERLKVEYDEINSVCGRLLDMAGPVEMRDTCAVDLHRASSSNLYVDYPELESGAGGDLLATIYAEHPELRSKFAAFVADMNQKEADRRETAAAAEITEGQEGDVGASSLSSTPDKGTAATSIPLANISVSNNTVPGTARAAEEEAATRATEEEETKRVNEILSRTDGTLKDDKEKAETERDHYHSELTKERREHDSTKAQAKKNELDASRRIEALQEQTNSLSIKSEAKSKRIKEQKVGLHKASKQAASDAKEIRLLKEAVAKRDALLAYRTHEVEILRAQLKKAGIDPAKPSKKPSKKQVLAKQDPNTATA